MVQREIEPPEIYRKIASVVRHIPGVRARKCGGSANRRDVWELESIARFPEETLPEKFWLVADYGPEYDWEYQIYLLSTEPKEDCSYKLTDPIEEGKALHSRRDTFSCGLYRTLFRRFYQKPLQSFAAFMYSKHLSGDIQLGEVVIDEKQRLVKGTFFVRYRGFFDEVVEKREFIFELSPFSKVSYRFSYMDWSYRGNGVLPNHYGLIEQFDEFSPIPLCGIYWKRIDEEWQSMMKETNHPSIWLKIQQLFK